GMKRRVEPDLRVRPKSALVERGLDVRLDALVAQTHEAGRVLPIRADQVITKLEYIHGDSLGFANFSSRGVAPDVRGSCDSSADPLEMFAMQGEDLSRFAVVEEHE